MRKLLYIASLLWLAIICFCERETFTLSDKASLLQTRTTLNGASKQPSSKLSIPLQLVLTGASASIDDLPQDAKLNVINTAQKAPGFTIRYLNDTGCRDYLGRFFEDEYVKIYTSEAGGSFRGDICRSAVLAREGGFYLDLDFEPQVPLRNLVDDSTTFMTVFAGPVSEQFINWQDPVRGTVPLILNAMIATRPNSPVMQDTMKRIKEHYAGTLALGTFIPEQFLLGPMVMSQAIAVTMRQACPEQLEAMSAAQVKCGADTMRFYQEEHLGNGAACRANGPKVCPAPRDTLAHLQYAVFSREPGTKEKRLIGWPRYSGCRDWGCVSF